MSDNLEVPKLGTVLVAEDIEANRELLKFFLESMNLEVIEAKDGSEAHQLFKKNTDITMVLMDVQMPVLNGVEATILIRRWERFIESLPTPIVAITAFDYVADIKRCMDAGMNDVLYKPVVMDALADIIDKYINSKKPKKETPPLTPQDIALEMIKNHVEMVFDFEQLQNIVNNQYKLAGVLAKEVMTAMPDYFKVLQEAIEAKNWLEVQAILNVMKTQLKQVGSVNLCKIIDTLNSVLANGGMIDIHAQEKIVEHYEIFEKELRAWLRTHLDYI
jgi:CheY-like chemotaxis protein